VEYEEVIRIQKNALQPWESYKGTCLASLYCRAHLIFRSMRNIV